MRRLRLPIGASLIHCEVTIETAIDILQTEDTEWEVKDFMLTWQDMIEKRDFKNYSKCTFLCIIPEAGQMGEDSEMEG
jgi:hypothetical protein